MARTRTGNTERKELGKVTIAERDEIRALFERKNGLAELFLCLSGTGGGELSGGEMYERLVRDMGETATKFQQWWEEKSKKYGWEGIADGKWEIDFETCAVYLAKK